MVAKSAVSKHSTVVATEDQVSSDLGGEATILDLRAGLYYGLDAVGARIWELIQEPKLVSEVNATILREYEVEPDRCERDVIALIQRLSQEGLVEILDNKSV